MTQSYLLLLISMFVSVTFGQRGSFAGTRPIGYPELANRTTTEGLGNRFGEGDGTTQRLPLEALGDRDLVDRLSKLPVDKQPFWFINWQALEQNRQNPQTYPQKPNPFSVPLVTIPSTDVRVNAPTSRPPNPNSGVPNTNVTTASSNVAATSSSSAAGSSFELGNRSGVSVESNSQEHSKELTENLND